MRMKKPYLLAPAFQDYLWGGTRLKEYYPACTADPLAEAWVLSCHPAGPSTLAGENRTLADLLARHPDYVGTRALGEEEFPILVKLIDAKKPLSVQVHPDDAYARLHENGPGKTEMWVVLDCEPGAALYYGFARPVTRQEFARRIAENTLTDVLRSVPVHKGDVFFIPAGTIHAIGAGMLIAEIQQNSNTTYRVYDYGRVGADGKPRALHLEQAMAVTNLNPAPAAPPATDGLLAACPYFAVARIDRPMTGRVDEDAFRALLVTSGSAQLTAAGERLTLAPYDCVFMPAGMGQYTLSGDFELLDITL